MKKLLYRSLLILLCLLLPVSSAIGIGKAAPGSAGILSVLEDGTMLLKDGTIVFSGGFPYKGFGFVDIAGNGAVGYGLTKEGKLVEWDFVNELHVVPGVSNVTQISGNYWLQSDGTLWKMNGLYPLQVDIFNGTALFNERDGKIATVTQAGEITRFYPSFEKPLVIDKVPDAASIRKIRTTGSQVAVLYADGRAILYDMYNFEPDTMKLIPMTLAQDAVDLSYMQSDRLLVVKKDGTVWINETGSQKDISTLSQVDEVDRIQGVVAGPDEWTFYAQNTAGDWIVYKDGEISPLTVPYLQGLSVTPSTSSPKVGDIIDITIKQVYSTGETGIVGQEEAKVTIDKPYLLQPLKDGSFKSLGVGEANLTVEYGGFKKTVKIGSILQKTLENAQVIKGVTYLPLTSVIQALGGTSSYTASTKTFAIKVGPNAIALTKGSAKAKVNGKAVTLKGTVFEEKGVTYFSADLLANVFGAKLNWDKSYQQLTVSLGAGKLVVKAKPAPSKSSGGMYAVAATGDMAGWSILKGHPYEGSFVIYFKYSKNSLEVSMKDIRHLDLNKKVTWTDRQGHKLTMTLKQLFEYFDAVSNSYTSDWLYATFGDYYLEWLAPAAVDAERLVTKYLENTGRIESPNSNVTLTPDAVVTTK